MQHTSFRFFLVLILSVATISCGPGDGAGSGDVFRVELSGALNAEFDDGSAEFVARTSGDFQQTSFTLMMSKDSGETMSLFVFVRGAPAPEGTYQVVNTITSDDEAAAEASPAKAEPPSGGDLVRIGQASSVSGTFVIEESGDERMHAKLQDVVFEEVGVDDETARTFTVNGAFDAVHP